MIDALAQFRQWKWIEVQKTAEELAKDEEYNEPLKVSFQDQKAKLAESLYGKQFNQEVNYTSNNSLEAEQPLSQEQGQESIVVEETQEQIDLSKFKENPNYPILERFTQIQWKDGNILDSTQLADEDLIQISDVLEKNKWEDPLEYLKVNLWEIDFKNPDTSNYLTQYIDKVLELNKDKKEIKNENWEEKLALPEEFKNNPVLNNENDDIVQLLVKNHTKLPDLNNWKPNFNKDILTTFEVTADKIIEWRIFPRNKSFELAMNNVKHWDIETRYNALSDINTFVNTLEWIKWERDELAHDGVENSENDINNMRELDYEITRLNEQLVEAKNTWDNKKIQELQLEISKLEQDKSSWEVFEWWSFDKVTDNDPFMSNKV